MTAIVIVMLGVLVLCGLVVLYVAYPHRGERMPGAPWLGAAMERAVDALPVMADQGVETALGEPTSAR